jgi:transposase
MELFGEDLTMKLKSAPLLSSRLRRRRKGMPTTPFLPLPDDLEIICIRETENLVEVQVFSHRSRCLCPGCSLPSQAIHSYYRRHPMELPCTGRRVRIILSVKKIFCHTPDCSRKVFTERIPELIEPSTRLATRLRTLVQTIGIAFNANGGACLAEQMGVLVSRRTVLFSVLLLPVPPVGQIKRVGIDDFGATRSYICSCKDSRKEDLTWGSALSALLG